MRPKKIFGDLLQFYSGDDIRLVAQPTPSHTPKLKPRYAPDPPKVKKPAFIP